jgi:cobalt-zinc-cadmium resistance protein CzcA
MTDVEMNLAPLMKELPSGYYYEYGGQFENQTRAMHRIAMVIPIALFLIVVLLTMALGSIRNALLVLLNLPLALVGGVLALVAFQLPVSVSAAVAGIVLLGIAVQNGVVLMTFFRQLQDRGESVTHAVIKGCDQRFRPLFMTAMTSFIGHLPMLGATGLGADLQKPLAVVVMGGLVTSTLLTLFVLPTLYSLGGKGRDEGNGTRNLGR